MLKWLKKSFESLENRASSKKLTGFWLVILTTFVVFAGIYNVVECKDLPTNFLYFLIIMLTSVLLLFMVITIESIIQFIKAVRNTETKE